MQGKTAKFLEICINNDSLCFQKSHIIDYSLLTIIDKKSKTIRFGIIDYLQEHNVWRLFETNYKKFRNRILDNAGDPTIIEPEKYRDRFTSFAKQYFIVVELQEEERLPKNVTKIELQNSMRDAQ